MTYVSVLTQPTKIYSNSIMFSCSSQMVFYYGHLVQLFLPDGVLLLTSCCWRSPLSFSGVISMSSSEQLSSSDSFPSLSKFLKEYKKYNENVQIDNENSISSPNRYWITLYYY